MGVNRYNIRYGPRKRHKQITTICTRSISTALATVLPAKDLWQSLSYVARWNGGPGSSDSCGWLRGERRAYHNKVITPLAGFQVPVWQLSVVSIITDSKQWPWLGGFGFCQIAHESCALWLDTFIFCLTSSTLHFSLAHSHSDHLWVELV